MGVRLLFVYVLTCTSQTKLCLMKTYKLTTHEDNIWINWFFVCWEFFIRNGSVLFSTTATFLYNRFWSDLKSCKTPKKKSVNNVIIQLFYISNNCMLGFIIILQPQLYVCMCTYKFTCWHISSCQKTAQWMVRRFIKHLKAESVSTWLAFKHWMAFAAMPVGLLIKISWSGIHSALPTLVDCIGT